MNNKVFKFTGIGKEIARMMEILSQDPNFDINEPMTIPFLEDVHSEINGEYELHEIMFALMQGSLYNMGEMEHIY